MFGMGELLVLGAVIFLFFGVKRLPQIGSALGKSVRLFKSGLEGDKKEREVIDVGKDSEKKSSPEDTE